MIEGQEMPQVNILVKLSGRETILKVPEGTRVSALSDLLEPEWRDNVVILINGKAANTEDLVHAQDRVLIFPLLAGG
jgi:hypothetical protein